MAKFFQFKVWRNERDLPLVLTFTSSTQASDFQSYLLRAKVRHEMNGPYKLFTKATEAIEEVQFWSR